MSDDGQFPKPLSEQQVRARRNRSIAIALALGAMVLLFYAATMVRMRGNVLNRPLAIIGTTIIGSALR